MQTKDGFKDESIAFALASGMVLFTGEEEADRIARRARWQRRKGKR